MMNNPLIQLKSVEKKYKKDKLTVNIFNDLNINLEKGGFYAIMGPSGSGKTTFLNILGGIDRVDSGEVWFDGRRIDQFSENQLSQWRADHIAFIFQSFNLLDILTAAQNVELPLFLTKLNSKERKARVNRALGLVDLQHRAAHTPLELSGGQQQRVAIARAIVSDTPLILCDEPTGNIDSETSIEILDTLRLLNSEFNKTIVMVTHDPKAAEYAKVIYSLENGQFIQQDRSEKKSDVCLSN